MDAMHSTRRLAVPALVATLAMTAACTAPAERTRWTTEFEYMRRGGTCETADGPTMCRLRVVVRDDGTWSATGVPAPPSEGTLPLGAASELAAIFSQSWRYFTEVPFTGVCPTETGGEEYGYVERRIPYGPGAERMDAQIREVRSCIHDLERYDSLVKRNQIETAWLALKPPELDHVQFR
jgi:hypothetical protein